MGVGLLGWCLGCQPASPPEADRAGSQEADQVLFGLTHLITVEGVKKALLTAERASVYTDRQQVEGERITVTFYNRLGQVTSTLTAEHGRLHQTTEEMDAWGSVVVRAEDGSWMETEALGWDPRQNQISSSARVILHQQGSTVRGTGLVTDPSLKSVRILNPGGKLGRAFNSP